MPVCEAEQGGEVGAQPAVVVGVEGALGSPDGKRGREQPGEGVGQQGLVVPGVAAFPGGHGQGGGDHRRVGERVVQPDPERLGELSVGPGAAPDCLDLQQGPLFR